MARERRVATGTTVARQPRGGSASSVPAETARKPTRTAERTPPRLEALPRDDRVLAALNGDGAGADAVPSNFTEAIYDAIVKSFASKNPTQLFCLSWPGTVMDYDRLSWGPLEEVAGNMPEDALVRSSLILDQYVPPAPITQPDGTRVSDRYAQALSQYGPRPNAALIQLQDIIRSRLSVQIEREVDVDGTPTWRTFTLAGWFDYLYGQWAQRKQVWAQKQLEMRDYFRERFADDPNRDAWWNAYLAWYGDNADAYIARINGGWQQLVAEFPLTQWEDAIAILDTRDNAGIQQARQILDNATRPLPYEEGVDFVPTQGVPYDWPLELKPVTKFIDLLADPEAQSQAYETALTQLQQEIFNWMAIVPQISDAQIQDDAAKLSEATSTFSRAQSALIDQYGRNTVDAIKMYCDIKKSRGETISGTSDKDEQTKITDDVNSTAGDLPGGSKGNVNWDQIKEVAEKIYEGQSTLINKQQGLIDAGLALAAAADRFLADKWNQSSYPWLPAYVTQLRSKLEALQRQWNDFSSAANVWYRYRSTAETSPAEPDPNRSAAFGSDSFPSPLDSPANDRWMTVTTTVSNKQLSSSTTMNTYFSATQWGLNLFFGSAGGSYQTEGSHFASEFMKAESNIQIGFLATKVLIERPWMHPEIFSHSRNLFRTTDTPLSPDYQVTGEELLGPAGNETIRDLINNHSFPCYPVALLLVKDVTVRVQIQVDRMQDMRDYAKSVKSQGGGFLCFSVSSTESSQSQSESTNEYCMAGQFIARAPAPQVIGYWLQFMPPDLSQVLSADMAAEIAQSLGFVNKLREVHTTGMAVREQQLQP